MIIEPGSFAANPDILEQLDVALIAENVAFIRFESTPHGVFVSVVKASDLVPKEPHCNTCQCNRVHAEMPTHPVERNVKRSKSWHHG